MPATAQALHTNLPIAIDPVSMLLPTEVYLKYLEIHHPHVPDVETIGQAMKAATPEQREFALNRAKSVQEVCEEVIKAAAAVRR